MALISTRMQKCLWQRLPPVRNWKEPHRGLSISDLSHNFTKGERSFVNTLVLNYVSDKIYTIGTQGYQDIMEQGVLTLDFVSQAKLNKHLSFNLKARNLLNSSYKLSRKANENGEKVILNDYKKGINISLGVSCTF